MTYKRGVTTDRAQPTVLPGRGVAGFKNAVAPIAGDRTRVFSPRQLVVPAVADTPVSAGGEELDLAGGGAAAEGTVVVTPPTEVDIAAALEAAAAPSAANPFVTESAVGPVGPVQSVNRLLSSAEILALFTTPITLVAAQAGKVIIPIWSVLVYRVNTTPYTWGGVGLDLGYPSMPLQVVALTGAMNNGVDVVQVLIDPFLDSALEPDVAGEPLRLSASGGNPTDGDGTLDLTVLYREVDVS